MISIVKFLYQAIKVFFVLIVLILVGTCIYTFNNTSTYDKQFNSKSNSNKNSIPLDANDLIHSSVDEITGKKSYYASTQSVYPTEQLRWPYSNLKSFIGFGCNSSSKNGWAYIGFTKNPNLIGGEYSRDGKIFRSRAKWDNQVGQVTFFVSLTEDRFLHLQYDNNFIRKIMEHSKLKIELQFYQEGNIYFEYKNLKIFSKAINLVKSKCRLL